MTHPHAPLAGIVNTHPHSDRCRGNATLAREVVGELAGSGALALRDGRVCNT
jgi:glyoxylase-like metal-dependent hydrolase (beta-lactamase superfamily II)